MRKHVDHFRCLLGLTVLLTICGCNRTVSPPAPLAADQIPPEMQKVFAKAGPEVHAIVDQVLGALQLKDYPAAYQHLQSLFALPAVTEPQRMLATRASLTLNDLMRTAQAQGDQNAAAFLEYQKKNK